MGATYEVLKDVGSLEGTGGHILDRLFVKLLWGTAFKAPSPVFLYNDGFLGERPLNPNPALLPQNIDSLELMAPAFIFIGLLISALVAANLTVSLRKLVAVLREVTRHRFDVRVEVSSNDEIGYILPRSQWDAETPFAYGREDSQYGEINSVGPRAAPILAEAFAELLGR